MRAPPVLRRIETEHGGTFPATPPIRGRLTKTPSRKACAMPSAEAARRKHPPFVSVSGRTPEVVLWQ